jgi:hypothetical protein
MRLHSVMIALLAAAVAAGASAQSTPPPTCGLADASVGVAEPVPVPAGYTAVSIHNTRTNDTIPLANDLKDGEFTPNATDIEMLETAKEEDYSNIQLLWAGGDEACLQPFSLASPPPVRVLLNETGIEGRYVNPVAPVNIDGRPLQFFNDTGDRTFVVTIPFSYSQSEASSAYAVASNDRGQAKLAKVVCAALPTRECKDDQETAIDDLERLRLRLEIISSATKGADPSASDCNDILQNGNCLVEYFFWDSVQSLGADFLKSFSKTNGDDYRVLNAVKLKFLVGLGKKWL